MASDGSGARSASGHGGSEWVVLVDVRGTLDDAHVDEHAGDKSALLRSGDVAFGTWDLLGDGHLLAGGEGTGSGRVDYSGVWASSVSGDNMDCARDGSSTRDLRKSGSGLCDDCGHAGEGVWASLSLSETISGGCLAVEDGGVDFGLLIGSGAWDDSSLNTETSGVSTSVTSLRLVSMDG